MVVAALLGCAFIVVAQNFVRVLDGNVVAGARVVRAERFAALGRRAYARVALYLLSVVDGCVTSWTADGIAVFRCVVVVVVHTRCTERH